jgi:hypothetical protein
MESIEPLESRIAPATFVVTNLEPTGAGSLRDAIVEANENPGADLILVEKGLTGTINVVGGEMPITDTLTIKGPGAGKLTLDGHLASRIFLVSNDDPETDKPLTVSGLTFFRGLDPLQGSSGGAIQSLESLKIRRCVFVNNQAFEAGGAIELTHGDGAPLSADIRGSSFVGNSCANVGGAIALSVSDDLILGSGSDKPILVQNCQFVGNRADNLAGAGTIDGEAVIVRGCVFNGNRSGQTAGGLDVIGEKIIIDRSAFIQNVAEVDAGGLNVTGLDSVIIRSSNFIGNSALGTQGGGLQISASENAVARIIASTISGNIAAGNGGGIVVNGGAGRLEIIGSRITSNQSEGEGGGILVYGGSAEFALIGSRVSGNLSQDGFGGGMALSTTSPAIIVNSVIAKNIAAVAGGIYVTGKLTLNGSTVTGNIATVRLGGIATGGQAPVLNGSEVSGNVSPDGVEIGPA